jgi:hypothetical protein
VLVTVAVLLVVFIGIVALVVDLGYLFVTRNQLQNVADASALAATRALGNMYQGLLPEEHPTFSCNADCASQLRAVAQAVADENRAGGKTITLVPEEIRIGQWADDTFTETPNQPDAVDVVARRDEFANDPVSTFFGRVLGIDFGSISTIATAALTGQSTMEAGGVLFPVTLSKWFFEGDTERCQDYIKFHPTDETSCWGWTTWYENWNTPEMEGILDGENISPEMQAGDDRILTGGGVSAGLFDNMLHLFKRQGCATTGEANPLDREYLVDADGCVTWEEAITNTEAVRWYEDGAPAYYPNLQNGQPDLTQPRFYHMWETAVPVYQYKNLAKPCENPGNKGGGDGWLVVGFAPVIISDVYLQPDNTIEGRVICDRVSLTPERGGGGEYGVKGSIPGLVR